MRELCRYTRNHYRIARMHKSRAEQDWVVLLNDKAFEICQSLPYI